MVRITEIQATLDQKEHEYIALDERLWQDEVLSAPLNKKAWVLQEMTLSPRVIHFAKNQVFWSCSQLHACESFSLGFPPHRYLLQSVSGSKKCRNLDSMQALLENEFDRCQRGFIAGKEILYGRWFEDNEPYVLEGARDFVDDGFAEQSKYVRRRVDPDFRCRIWQSIVTDHSSRKLSFRKDKAMAILGVADEMQRRYNTTYIAGLFQEGLPNDLLWICPTTARQNVWSQVPSWSWLRLDGKIKFLCDEGINAPKVEILGSSCNPDYANPGGPIIHGSIRLRGRLARGLIDR